MPRFERPRIGRLVTSLVALVLCTTTWAADEIGSTQQKGGARPLPSDEVTRANVLDASGHRDEAIALLELRVRTNPDDALAKQTLLSLRIAQMEEEIRQILGEQSKAKELVIGDPDYESARNRADAAVTKRLDVAEYYAHNRRYAEAAMVCNAILRDYPHHPAALKLKYRILSEMVERERAELLKDKALRRDDAINDTIDDAIMPGEKPKSKRTIFIFDEDIAELERSELQKKLLQRIDLVYDGTNGTKSAKVREVLQPLFAIAGINYVILDSALSDETFTINMVHETVEKALSVIAQMVNIRYNYSGGTVFVSSADSEVLVTDIIRIHSGLTDVKSEPKLGGTPGGGGGGGGSGSGGQGGGNRSSTVQGGAGLFSGGEGGEGGGAQEFVSDLERFLEKVPEIIVGWPDKGKIYLEKKSNTIYITATPSAIMEAKRLLAAMDYNSTQVSIEARFIEVTDAGAKELGVDWAGGAANSTTYLGAPTTGLDLPTSLGDGATLNNSYGNISGIPTGTGGLLAQLLVQPSDYLKFKATISAMETSGKADTLSEPKILTLNNAVGFIEVKQDITYISGYTNAGTNSSPAYPDNNNGGNVINPGYNYSSTTLVPEFTTDQSGIELRIRPSVARNSDIITLTITPSVREMVKEPVSIDFNNSNGANGGDPITNKIQSPPLFDTRRLVTALHVKNGGTVALGGLTKEKTRESTTGVPFMSRVPVLGSLFRRDSKSSERRNLMIFVTAHIVDPEGAKQGNDIQHLRDTARVVLPENYDKLPTPAEAAGAAPKADANGEDAGPIWRRERRR
jgi:type II secretory pathway component GspD/PulD (secretin)